MNNTIKAKPAPLYGIILFERNLRGEYPQIVDIYCAPNVDMIQVKDAAAEFGSVGNEGHYLRLTINPTFDEDEVIAYLASLWPERGDEIQDEPAQETPDALVEVLEEDGDAR